MKNNSNIKTLELFDWWVFPPFFFLSPPPFFFFLGGIIWTWDYLDLYSNFNVGSKSAKNKTSVADTIRKGARHGTCMIVFYKLAR